MSIPSHTSKHNRTNINETKQHLMLALRATHIAAMTAVAATAMQLLTTAGHHTKICFLLLAVVG
eukprot:14368840-Ditylum_brightwellii.AAC.1